MNQTKELQWGETPFDHMSHEELLVQSKRMYMALVSAHEELHKFRHVQLQHNPADRYWTGAGAGNKAWNRSEQAITRARDGYSDENIHRSYFRYASMMLFSPYPGSEFNSSYWGICDTCKEMIGTSMDGLSRLIYTKHEDNHPGCGCPGKYRALTPDDLKPVK